MARKETDTVALTLRIRERLRHRIQEAADKENVSLNSEIVERLENSFLLQRNDLLIETLLGSGFNLHLLQMMSAILKLAGKDWMRHKQKRSAVVGAISKIIAHAAGETKSLPKHPRKDSADYFANMAIMFSPDWMPLEELAELVQKNMPLEEIPELVAKRRRGIEPVRHIRSAPPENKKPKTTKPEGKDND